MSADDPKTLVSTQWLADHLKDPDLRVIDASYYLPDMGRDAKAEYDAAHIRLLGNRCAASMDQGHPQRCNKNRSPPVHSVVPLRRGPSIRAQST